MEVLVVPLDHVDENSEGGVEHEASCEGGKVEKSKGVLRSAWSPELLSNVFLSRTVGVLVLLVELVVLVVLAVVPVPLLLLLLLVV